MRLHLLISVVVALAVVSQPRPTFSAQAKIAGSGKVDGSAALSAPVLGRGHSATLTWTASTSENVTGYNLYRATATGGPYAKLNSIPVAGLAYTDTAVQAGQTYFYVATAVDASGNESGYSNEATAGIPTP